MVKRLTLVIASSLAMATTTALAGMVQPAPVDVDTVTRFAGGDMTTARYSDDKNVFIGCGIRKIQDGAGGIFSFGFCQAEDAEEERGFCNTQDAGLLDAISSSADQGYVTFSWNEDDECTRIGFSNQSFYLPTGLDSNE